MPEEVYDRGKKINAQGTAELYVDDAKAVITADKGIGVVAHKDHGVAIQGELAIKAKPQEVYIGFLYMFNDMLMTTLPSTIYTPIPTLRQGMNTKIEKVGELADSVSEMQGALEALG